jgi:polygalacturonase
MKNATAKNPYAFRPFMLRIHKSAAVTVQNLTFLDSPFWCIVPTYSTGVTVAHTVINSHG